MTSAWTILLLALALLLCAGGWGWGAARLLQRPNGGPVRGPAPALGLAVLLVLCAVLNLVHGLRPAAYAAILIAGLGLCGGACWSVWRDHGRAVRAPARLAAFCAIGAVAALPTLTRFVHLRSFNPHDDAYAYLVSTKRVLDTGTLGTDPFSYRTRVAGAGALSTVQAPAVALFGWPAVRVVDEGLGSLLLVCGLAWLLERRRAPWPVALAILVGIFALPVPQIVNTTSHYLTYALFVGLFAWATERDNTPPVRAVCTGLLLAALVALKNTALPVALLFVALMTLEHHGRQWRRLVQEGLITLAAAAAPLAVWYAPRLSQRVESTVLRYGSGPDEASWGYIWFYVSTEKNLVTLRLAGALLLMALVGLALVRRTSQAPAARAIVASTSIGCVALTWLTGGAMVARYNGPFVILACIGIAVTVGSRVPLPRGLQTLAVITLLASLALCRSTFLPWTYPRDLARAIASLRSAPAPYQPDDQEALRSAQAALPAGASALVRVSSPYLLDFARNRLYVVDVPNGASPSPGMQHCPDIECVSTYLQAQGIPYVMYAYANQAGFPIDLVASRLRDPYYTPWQRALNRPVLRANRLYRQLTRSCRAVYDDGQVAVIDVRACR